MENEYMKNVIKYQKKILNIPIDKFLPKFYETYTSYDSEKVNAIMKDLSDYGLLKVKDLVKLDKFGVITFLKKYDKFQEFLCRWNLDLNMTDVEIKEIELNNTDVSSLFIPLKQYGFNDNDIKLLENEGVYNLHSLVKVSEEDLIKYECDYMFNLNHFLYVLNKKNLKMNMTKKELEWWGLEHRGFSNDLTPLLEKVMKIK